MLKGPRVALRPIREADWEVIEEWGSTREGLWGPFQRFQLDHMRLLREAFDSTGLLTRDSGFLIIELRDSREVAGFVRYTLLPFPDSDMPYPEIGFGLDPRTRGQGYAMEAAALLVDYLFAGYTAPRVAAFTDVDNLPAQHVLEKLGFRREGVLRRSTFRDGAWHDLALYAVLRDEWEGVRTHSS